MQVNDQRDRLYAAVDPGTDHLRHVHLCTTRTTALTQMFLAGFHEEHLVDDAIILVDGAPWLQAACHHHSLRFQHGTHENRNAVERVCKELKRRRTRSRTTFDTLNQQPWTHGFNRLRVLDPAPLRTASHRAL